jgi:hypothetical protein
VTPDICVIGAGISGIAALRALKREGLQAVCYEAGSRPGGLWWIGNDNGMSNIYQSLHTNTSTSRTGFSDHPMPDSLPDFPHHSEMLEYLDEYLDHFGLNELIETRHRVLDVAPAPENESAEGGYQVNVQLPDGKTQQRTFHTVVVCNGHHWDPFKAELPGRFAGPVIHSSEYKSPEGFSGKRVLVVGAGNSACDIATDLSRTAKVTMSTRSGAHVIPKYLLGKPLDQWTSDAMSRLPMAIQRRLFASLVFLTRGRQSRYGFPVPDTPFLTAHPTISSDLLKAVGRGRVSARPGIESIEEQRVHFVDGSTDVFDLIILATGYSLSFPFFDPAFISVEGNELPLYRHVVHPDHAGLFFIGLIQPLGALAPLAEAQAGWVAAMLAGKASRPSRQKMVAQIDRDRKAREKNFVRTRRHTMEVEFFSYLRGLKSEY